MNFDDLKSFVVKILNNETTRNQKIQLTASIGSIVFIGYLTWWNGLKNPSLDKSFRWDEWFWFGIVAATVPYIFYFIWKKRD